MQSTSTSGYPITRGDDVCVLRSAAWPPLATWKQIFVISWHQILVIANTTLVGHTFLLHSWKPAISIVTIPAISNLFCLFVFHNFPLHLSWVPPFQATTATTSPAAASATSAATEVTTRQGFRMPRLSEARVGSGDAPKRHVLSRENGQNRDFTMIFEAQRLE